MNLLNRYVLKQFVRPFIASFAALCVLIVVSQLFEQLDRFLAEGVNLRHVIGFLLTSLPIEAIQVLPVACLLATLFVVGTLARTREYIAGLAGGIPPEKFLGGILAAGFFLSVVSLIANETIVPPATLYASRVYREKIRRLGEWHQSVYADLFVAGAEGRLWNAKRFDERSGDMTRVIVDSFQDGKLGMQVDAESALWEGGQWTFFNGITRTFAPDNSTIVEIKPFEKLALPFHENPSDMVTQEPRAEEMNYETLKRHIRRLSSLGVPVRKLQVELLMKLSTPFACFVVTFLGIPLAMKGRGNRAIGIATGVALTLIYLAFIQVGKALAQRFVPPILGAWLSNILFLAVGTYLWIRLRRTA